MYTYTLTKKVLSAEVQLNPINQSINQPILDSSEKELDPI